MYNLYILNTKDNIILSDTSNRKHKEHQNYEIQLITLNVICAVIYHSVPVFIFSSAKPFFQGQAEQSSTLNWQQLKSKAHLLESWE